MLQTVFMVFMAFVALVCAFAILVVVRDILREQHEDRKNRKCEEEQEEKENEEVVAEVEEEATNENLEEDDKSNKLQPPVVLSLEEKYLNLPAKFRKFYDEIVRYAGSFPNVKHVKNTRFEEFKLRKSRVVRLLIKKDVVICEFVLPNPDFKNYISENNINVKLSAISLKILDSAAVKNAKDCIDIAVRSYEEELANKEQAANETNKDSNIQE